MNNTVKGILYALGAVAATAIVIKVGSIAYKIKNGDIETPMIRAETKARQAAIQIEKSVYEAAIAAGKNESIAKQEKNKAYDNTYATVYNETLADEMAKINAAKKAKTELDLVRTSAYNAAIAEGKSEKNATAISEKAYQDAYRDKKSDIVGGRRITRRTRHKKNYSRKGR